MVKTFDEAYELLKPYPSDFFMSIMLAQWALESDKGRSELALKAYNFTGHKAQPDEWPADRVYKKDTIEDDGEGTKFIAPKEPFRLYHNPQEWAKHHASWLQRLPDTYAKVISAKTVEEQAQALQGTYATDTTYAKKLMDMIKANNLTRFDIKKESAKMPTVLLIAGHGLNTANGYFDPGARGYVPKGEHRWYTEDVFPAMRKYLPKDADVVFHTAYNVYSRANIVALAKSYGNDTIVIECHFDSGGTAYSKPGGHVIIYKDFSADALDLRLRDAIQETVGLHPHYAQGISKRDNLQNVNLAARGGVNYRLVEWGMSSDKSNGTYMVNNVDAIAKAFVKAVFQETNDNATAPKPTETKDPHNPQGLKESSPSAYVPPRLPFTQLKVGDTATILADKNGAGNYIWQWYNPTTNKLMVSGKQAELAGKADKVKEVKKIDRIQHSEYMYLLEETNSWILEEYLQEPRKLWDEVDEDIEEPSEEVAIYDGDYVQLHGKRYKVGDEIK